jgi:hypothetical protein
MDFMTMSPENVEALSLMPVAEPSAASQAFARVVAKRRSVYSYQRQPVPRGLVDLAQSQALQAPNHHRIRPLRLFAFVDGGLDALADAYAAAVARLAATPA